MSEHDLQHIRVLQIKVLAHVLIKTNARHMHYYLTTTTTTYLS